MKKVLLHGWGCNAAAMAPLQKALQEALGSETHCIDYANNTDFEEQVIAELRHHTPCHLIAWSMGGMIAINCWEALAKHVAALSLIAVPDRFCGPNNQSRERLDQMIASLEANPARELKRFWRSAAPRGYRPPPAKLDPHWLRQGLDYLGAFDAAAQARLIRVPTTIIQGSDDPICLSTAARALQQLLPQAQLHCIDGAGHSPFLDNDEICSLLT